MCVRWAASKTSKRSPTTVIDPEHQLRLGDVAEVSYKQPEQDWVNRIDRKEAMAFGVTKSSGANVVEVSNGVKEVLEQLKNHPQLEGLDFKLVWNQGDQVTNSVNNLKNSGLWGGLFAGGSALFLFTRGAHHPNHHLGDPAVASGDDNRPVLHRLVVEYGDDDGADAEPRLGG